MNIFTSSSNYCGHKSNTIKANSQRNEQSRSGTVVGIRLRVKVGVAVRVVVVVEASAAAEVTVRVEARTILIAF